MGKGLNRLFSAPVFVFRMFGCDPRNVHVVEHTRLEYCDKTPVEFPVEFGACRRVASLVTVVDGDKVVGEVVWGRLALGVGHIRSGVVYIQFRVVLVDTALYHLQQLLVDLLQQDGRECLGLHSGEMGRQHLYNRFVACHIVCAIGLQGFARRTLFDGLDFFVVLWVARHTIPRDEAQGLWWFHCVGVVGGLCCRLDI